MDSPVSPVITNIYMQYFEELVLTLNAPYVPFGGKDVDDVISIVKKEQLDTPKNHLNYVDSPIKFIVEAIGNDDSFSFMATKCSPNSDHIIHTSVYRKPTQIYQYLDWNSNHPTSTKKSNHPCPNVQS